jgi:hypothetical protein
MVVDVYCMWMEEGVIYERKAGNLMFFLCVTGCLTDENGARWYRDAEAEWWCDFLIDNCGEIVKVTPPRTASKTSARRDNARTRQRC